MREARLSDTPPRQHAQELRFTLTLDGGDVEVMQAQFLTAVPTEGSGDYLMQTVLSAPADVYPAAKGELAEFVESLSSTWNSSAGGTP